MNIKVYFGFVGLILVGALASTVVVRCVAEDLDVIAKTFKKALHHDEH